MDWQSWRQYIESRVDYSKLIKLYPDLYWAHERLAWILATSPDASHRDGRRAVAAATRAAELTNWKDGQVFATLAAAYAEADDYAKAVQWQERALKVFAADGSTPKPDQERLALYRGGKPFRLQP